MKTCIVCGEKYYQTHVCNMSKNQQLAKDCLLIINKAFEKSNSGQTIVQNMRELNNLYPDIGFSQEAFKLEKILNSIT